MLKKGNEMIEKITFKTKSGKEIELSHDEARQLHKDFNELFGRNYAWPEPYRWPEPLWPNLNPISFEVGDSTHLNLITTSKGAQ